jgi:hypothetical protein
MTMIDEQEDSIVGSEQPAVADRRKSSEKSAADRRDGDRREGLDRRRGPGRRRAELRKAAEEGEMSGELLEFVMAIEEYKRINTRPFPSWSEVFEIIQYLGYRRVADRSEHINQAESAGRSSQ